MLGPRYVPFQDKLSIIILESLDFVETSSEQTIMIVAILFAIVLLMCPLILNAVYSLTAEIQGYSINLADRWARGSLQSRHMSTIAPRITGNPTVCSISCIGWRKRKHQSPTLLSLCVGKAPVADEFPPQWFSNVESFSILWRHHWSAMCLKKIIVSTWPLIRPMC